MGALSGSMTATAYYVDGEPPKDFRDRYTEAVQKRRFRDIDVDADHDESHGWVTVHDPFDTEFDPTKFHWNQYVLLGLRHDVLRIPQTAFKLQFRRALDDYLQRSGKEKATRAEEDEVREHLERQLRRRILPTIRLYEMAWHLERQEVWLFTSNKRMNESFQELFTDTFELELVPRNAYSRMERMGYQQEWLDHAVGLEPTAFASPSR